MQEEIETHVEMMLFFMIFKKRIWDKSISDIGCCSPRYFHSICVWRGLMCLFGGLGINSKVSDKKPVDLNDFFMFGSDVTIGMADLIERVDNSSITETMSMMEGNKKTIEISEKKLKTSEAKRLKFMRKHGLIGTLLPEMKLHILIHCDFKAACRMSCVNKAWYLISTSEGLWEHYFVDFITKEKKRCGL